MTDMTIEEARGEAVRRWGASASVAFRPGKPAGLKRGRLARYTHIVGGGRGFTAVEGQGHSWREAFENARPR